MIFTPSRGFVLAVLFMALTAWIARSAEPTLQVFPEPNQRLRLEWPASGQTVLEASAALEADWQPVSEVAAVIEGVARVYVSSGEQTRFFRLRQTELTRVSATSPLVGETGVAVTRETILRFSAPLAADTVLTTDRYFVEADGRRLLGRVELGSDRRSATLFHLEPVPANTRVQVTFVGTGVRDVSSSELDAEGDGEAGGTFRFTFDTAPIQPAANTAVSGHVFASERNPDGSNRPLAGVIVTVDGAEESLRTTTDASGFFQLNSCPVGRFFVHIDGRSVAGSEWPSGAYYPFVGKAWETVAGQTNTLPGGTGEIFLPLIPSGALREVSPLVPTAITFTPEVLAANPALAGVQIVVPPNALFADSGARGGRVGLAPVPPDRLPEPLPPGLEMPLVITIQTDGPQNFAEPVPVRFPNLPDPKTGLKLPPGAKSGLWSFNHDTGRWELQGPMTVSADGNYLDTDAGVGVRQPGWHGSNPGSDTDDEAPDEPPDEDEDKKDEKSPFEKCKAEIGNLVNSGLDCAFGAVLPAKLSPDPDNVNRPCAVGLGLAAVATVRDCLLDSGGCKATVINNSGGAAIGCGPALSEALGRGSKFLGPVATVAGAIHGCVLGPGLNFCAMADCLEQSSGDSFCVPDEWETGLQRWLNDWDFIGNAFSSGPSPARVRPQDNAGLGEAPAEFLAEAQTNAFFTQVRFTLAMRQYFIALYGTEKWFPDNSADALVSAAFLRQLNQSTEPEGDGGAAVSPAERASLLALPRPTGASELEAQTVITRMERIFTGTITDAELNLRALIGTALKYGEMAAVYQALGWDDPTEAFNNGLIQISQRFESRCQSAGGIKGGSGGGGSGGSGGGGGGGGGAQGSAGSRPPRPLSYLLQNLDTGFALRGKTQTGASLGSMVFAPNTYYALFFVDDLTGATTVSFFKSAGPGETTKIPCAMWLNGGLPLVDTDGDGLSDLAERAAGTSLILGDTDGDGRSDRLELSDGSNPLDGLARPNGLVGSAQVPNAQILTVAAEGSTLYAGGAELALSIFDLAQPDQPLRLGTLALPGQNVSHSLAVQSGMVAAGGVNGLALMDARDPVNPVLVTQLPLGNVLAVAWWDTNVVALAGSSLYVVDGTTGAQRFSLPLPEAGHDVQTYGDTVYVLTASRLMVFRQVDFLLLEQGRISVAGTASPLEIGRKLFVGGGRAYIGTFGGFSVVDVSNPVSLVMLGTPPSTQAAIHDLAANDAGLLLPVVSFSGTTTLAVGAYDVSDPKDVTRFLTSWTTPGNTRALTLHQGLAYVADTAGDVQVLNYLSPDLAGMAPTIAFTANFPLAPARAVFASRLHLLVDARDDVQVREVTALVDGVPVAGDGSFPFQLDFTAPARGSGRTNFTLQLRATDTAGNTRSTAPLVVELVDDLRPPQLLSAFPNPSGRTDNFGLTNLLLEFDQPLALDSITAGSLTVVGAGADKVFDTADDVVRSGVANRGADPKWLEWVGTNQFPAGLFRITLAAGLKGTNNLARLEPVSWFIETVSIRPRLAATTPSGTSAMPLEGVTDIEARLDLAIAAYRATNALFVVREAGPDRVRGTTDDLSVPLSSVQFDVASGRFHLKPTAPLAGGRYRVALSGAGFLSSLVDFELRPIPNEWLNPAGGRWDAASNWSAGAPLANDYLRIPRLVPGLTTTNRSSATINRLETEADFVQEPGVLTLTGDAFFDGLSRFLGSDVGGPSLGGGGTLINRGTMQIAGGMNFINRALALQDITIANRGLLEWLAGQVSFAEPTSLIFNEPSGIFDVGAQATRTLVGTSSSGQRGRIVNAGLLRKVANTNVTTLRTVTVENSGRILVGAGQLELGDLTGPGEIEIQPGASVAVIRSLRLPTDARIHGGGNFSIMGGSSNAPVVLSYRHELTGVATAEANFIDIRRALSHPGIQFQSRNGWFRFFAPLNAHRIWNFKGSFGGIQLNAPTTTEILQLDQGILAGPGTIAVTQNLLWTDGTVEAGGEITVHKSGEIRGSAVLTQRQIRILPGAVVVGVSNAYLTTFVRGLEGRIINEGTFIKRGAGRMTFRVKLENRGLMRFEEGQLLVERQPQGDGQFYPVTGELQFAGGELALYLQSFNGATLTQTNGLISGFGRIINIGGGFGNKVENRTLVRLNVPGKALEIVTMGYQQNAAGELEVTLGSAGCGQLVGDPSYSLNLAGRLRVVLEPGFVPELGQSFTVCQGRRSGTFGEVVLPDIGPGRKLEVTYLTDQVVVTVIASP